MLTELEWYCQIRKQHNYRKKIIRLPEKGEQERGEKEEEERQGMKQEPRKPAPPLVIAKTKPGLTAIGNQARQSH